MFGIPNVGTNLCGYYDTDDQELCARYFEIAIVSPLAVFNKANSTIPSKPFGLDEEYMSIAYSALQQRLSLMIYMRTNLYLIQKFGGALVKPLIAVFPNDDLFALNDVS
jgi:alpha-D-xyloside xylohydrolase